jgi:hypothetical protein
MVELASKLANLTEEELRAVLVRSASEWKSVAKTKNESVARKVFFAAAAEYEMRRQA